MAEGSPLPEWIKPHHIATIKSIISKKEFTEFFFENTSMQKLYIGNQNILLKFIQFILDEILQSNTHPFFL